MHLVTFLLFISLLPYCIGGDKIPLGAVSLAWGVQNLCGGAIAMTLAWLLKFYALHSSLCSILKVASSARAPLFIRQEASKSI